MCCTDNTVLSCKLSSFSDSMFRAGSMGTEVKTLCVEYDNVTLCFTSISGSLGICSALVVNPINDLTGRPVESFLHLVQRSLGIFAFGESLPEVVPFLLEQLRLAAHCFSPMGEGVDYTKLVWEVMVTIPV